MVRLGALLSKLQRVLELAERALAERVGEPLPADAFSRHLAFRWDATTPPGRLVPIAEPDLLDLTYLIGVDRNVARLVANAEQFVACLPAAIVERENLRR
jgi:predicted AAA+ superfamily ATPase